MKKMLVLALSIVMLALSFGCASKQDVTRIRPIRSQYTVNRMGETATEDLHMAREDLIWLFGFDEPSRLSPEEGFRF